MPEALNKVQAKDLIQEAFVIAGDPVPTISDPPAEGGPVIKQLQFCHMKFHGKVHKLKLEQLQRDLTKIHNVTDELNKFIIAVASPDEEDLQEVTVHVGKLKTP